MFELAWRNRAEPAKIRDIAQAQAIPGRFLEVILSQLRGGGFVESRRGKAGGYTLARAAEELTVGEIIEYVQGPIEVVTASAKRSYDNNRAYGNFAFDRLWERLNSSIVDVCGEMTFAELVKQERAHRRTEVRNYAI